MTGPQGELLANRYELSSLIAGGGMGQVWRGRDTLLDRPVAVKVLRDQFAADPAFRTRFRAEAQHAATLTHPHIAAVFDYGELPGSAGTPPVAYLVMELVEGESLADVLRREGRLDVPRTLDVLRQAADGLGAAHAAGVVHRDIKPANLLVSRDGRVKLTDFGIARSAASIAITATGQVLGTAHYLSPEQAAGRPASPASDVYALGTVGYECLAGRRAFEGESAVQIAVMQIRDQPDPLPVALPPAVRALVERAMAKDPAVRFRDGSALRDGVDAVLSGAPAAALPRTAVLPAVPAAAPTAAASAARPRRRRWPVAALMAVLLLTAGAVVLATALRDGSTPETGEATTEETGPAAPTGIDVVAGNLVGRPVREVQAELIGRGLRVEVVPVETAEAPAGRVTAVDPAGTLPPDALVRLSYAVPPVPEPAPLPAPAPVDEGGNDGDEGGNDGDEGNGDGEDGGNGNQGNGNGNQGNGNRGDGDRGDGDRGDETRTATTTEPARSAPPAPVTDFLPVAEIYDCTDPAARAAGLDDAAEALSAGRLVLLPTDTVYGVAADAFDPDAVTALLAAKNRGRGMPVPVLIGEASTLAGLVLRTPPAATALAQAFWPGGLTLVVEHAPSLAWDLGDAEGTVAVRLPGDDLTRDLLRRTGPLAVSSANRSGRPAATTAQEAADQLGEHAAVVLDGGPRTDSAPSTIVDCTGATPRVLRVGAIPVDRLRDAVPEITD